MSSFRNFSSLPPTEDWTVYSVSPTPNRFESGLSNVIQTQQRAERRQRGFTRTSGGHFSPDCRFLRLTSIYPHHTSTKLPGSCGFATLTSLTRRNIQPLNFPFRLYRPPISPLASSYHPVVISRSRKGKSAEPLGGRLFPLSVTALNTQRGNFCVKGIIGNIW